MTDRTPTQVSAAQLDRIAQLRARRGHGTLRPDPASPNRSSATDPEPATPPVAKRRRRRHVARDSRIVAAGLGAATMFGIVGMLGLDNPLAAANDPATRVVTPPVATAAPPPIQVIVHRVPAPPVAPSASPAPEPTTNATTEPAVAATPPAPIVLTANPVVRTVTVAAPAPARATAPAPAATSPAPAATARTGGSK